MIILTYPHGGHEAGTILELPGEVENTLIHSGRAEKHPGPATFVATPKKPDTTQPAPARPLTATEALRSLRDEILAIKALLARGSKSDMDAIGATLDRLAVKVEQVSGYPKDEPTPAPVTHSKRT